MISLLLRLLFTYCVNFFQKLCIPLPHGGFFGLSLPSPIPSEIPVLDSTFLYRFGFDTLPTHWNSIAILRVDMDIFWNHIFYCIMISWWDIGLWKINSQACRTMQISSILYSRKVCLDFFLTPRKVKRLGHWM